VFASVCGGGGRVKKNFKAPAARRTPTLHIKFLPFLCFFFSPATGAGHDEPIFCEPAELPVGSRPQADDSAVRPGDLDSNSARQSGNQPRSRFRAHGLKGKVRGHHSRIQREVPAR